jgi:predicted amidohydrolase
VENQVYVIGAGQVGRLPPGMPACHGHSMIVGPWGDVMAERTAPDPGVVVADLDFARLTRIRAELPVLAHRRPEAYL